MEILKQRRMSLILLGELTAVMAVAGILPKFPKGVASEVAWPFVISHWPVLLHVILGFLVLGHAAFFAVTAKAKIIPGAIFIGTLLGVVAGCLYVSNYQSKAQLSVMTMGWLIAFLAGIVGLVQANRALKSQGMRLT